MILQIVSYTWWWGNTANRILPKYRQIALSNLLVTDAKDALVMHHQAFKCPQSGRCAESLAPWCTYIYIYDVHLTQSYVVLAINYMQTQHLNMQVSIPLYAVYHTLPCMQYNEKPL